MSYDKELAAVRCAMWRNTCDVAKPLLQAELLLYTVMYCELDRKWHWIGCITCNGYVVTNVTAGNVILSGRHFVTVSWLYINANRPARMLRLAAIL